MLLHVPTPACLSRLPFLRAQVTVAGLQAAKTVWQSQKDTTAGQQQQQKEALNYAQVGGVGGWVGG